MFAPVLLQADMTAGFVGQFWVYAIFIALVVVLLLLDLLVFHRKSHVIGMREAVGWSVFWVALGLLFTIPLYFLYENHWAGFGLEVPQVGGGAATVDGWEAAKLYVTGYLIEKSLSMDNLFVIAMIFSYFSVPLQYQHRTLFWGILTAVILRGIMIALGAALIHNFEWIVYVFGAFLILTALKMAFTKEEGVDPEKNPAVRLVRKFFPVTHTFDEQHFFTRNSEEFPGRLAATPLLLALVMIETADVIFAVDSIPAIFGITADPFIVFTSNIFAILGLRALFFCLAVLIDRFHYLKVSLVAILGFVGAKMLAHSVVHISAMTSLLVVLGLLAAGVVASWLRPRPVKEEDAGEGTL